MQNLQSYGLPGNSTCHVNFHSASCKYDSQNYSLWQAEPPGLHTQFHCKSPERESCLFYTDQLNRENKTEIRK